jgi:hypothetical protein
VLVTKLFHSADVVDLLICSYAGISWVALGTSRRVSSASRSVGPGLCLIGTSINVRDPPDQVRLNSKAQALLNIPTVFGDSFSPLAERRSRSILGFNDSRKVFMGAFLALEKLVRSLRSSATWSRN